MPVEHVPLDRATYVPGDPWTQPEFLTLAQATPRILTVYDPADPENVNNTPPSYFEYRNRHRGADQRVEISVNHISGDTSFEVHLERSADGGDTWGRVKGWTADAEESMIYAALAMLRLRVVSAGVDTVLQLRLFQNG